MTRGLGQTPDPVSVAAPAPQSDFLNITGGISAILAPLAQVGVSIYQTSQLQKLEKARMKAEAAAQNAMAMMVPPPMPVAQSSGSGLLIGVVIGGVSLVALLVILLSKKGSEGSAGATSVASSSVSSTSAAPAPRIKRIKRISRPRLSY